MTKNDIIDAAFDVWGRELYKTTSLTVLTEKLGVSKPALYRHFPGKTALLDAMKARFYDDYTAELRPVVGEALAVQPWREKFLLMARFIMTYFSRHFDYFIYSLIYIHGRKDHLLDEEEFTKRGVFLSGLAQDLPLDRQFPSALFLAGTTALFETAKFHKKRSRNLSVRKAEELSGESAARPFPQTPSETGAFVDVAAERVRRGLGFDKEAIDRIPFDALESLALGRINNGANGGPDPLLKAVAEAIAETGPWNASMETVAKASGISKSGLYAHFRNKQDMLSRLFMTEFERIAETAAACSILSEYREERLYLTLFSITEYLKNRPEILIALDWVRIQRLELDLSVPNRIVDFFTGLDLDNSENTSQWALFLVVAALMRCGFAGKKEPRVPDEDRFEASLPGGIFPQTLTGAMLRKIFRFITLGIEGM